jgi:hypothetical protein
MRTSPLFLTLLSSAAFLLPLSASAAPSDASITRAEFVQMMVEKFYDQKQLDGCFVDLSNSEYKLLFRDVNKDATYAKAVCVGMINGFVRGYGDGTFQPDRPINVAEAGKIVARVFGTTNVPAAAPGQAWYRPYVESLTLRKAVPTSVKTFSQLLSRNEAVDILTRLESGNTSNPSSTYADLERQSHVIWKKQ